MLVAAALVGVVLVVVIVKVIVRVTIVVAANRDSAESCDPRVRVKSEDDMNVEVGPFGGCCYLDLAEGT